MLQNIFEPNNVFLIIMLHLEKGFHFRNGFDVTTKNEYNNEICMNSFLIHVKCLDLRHLFL